MAKDEDDGQGLAVLKGALLALGALTAVSLGLWLFKPLVLIGMIAGAGYLGYRAFGKTKELQAGKESKALGAGDFERRMRELEEDERRVDAEIRRNS
ncbi:MAG: hypothetical protein U0168_18780 [Nannocystaceae bacterium]|jgi:uncharacterized membrane protein YebE (DUF533 family)|nr:hypothetical protein [Nannocystaceae bacterium]